MLRVARLCCVGAILFSGGPSCVLAHNSRQATLRGAGSSDGFSEQSTHSELVQTRSKTRRMLSRSPEQLQKWEDSHQAVFADAATINPSALLEMSQGINAKAFGDELHDLCDLYQSRFVGTSGNANMAEKIKNKFSSLGLKTWTEELDVTSVLQQHLKQDAGVSTNGNIIGLLKGTDLAHEVVIVGAHYDSVNWEKKSGKAPGVDDNGSGSALVQLVAGALTRMGVKPRRSIMFVAFNAEEEGLVGSEQMAKKAALGKYGDVKAVLIADEVAYAGVGKARRKAIFETVGDVPGTSSLLDTFAHHAQVLNGDGINGFEVNNHGFGSDHMSWLKRKVPALLLIERDNIVHADTWGHSARDTFDHVDFDFGAAMSRLMLRAASALGSPAGSTVSVALMRNVSQHAL